MSSSRAFGQPLFRLGPLLCLAAGFFLVAGCGDKKAELPSKSLEAAKNGGISRDERSAKTLPDGSGGGDTGATVNGFPNGGGDARAKREMPPSKDGRFPNSPGVEGFEGETGLGITAGHRFDRRTWTGKGEGRGEGKGTEKTKEPASPQVWHRDRQRPPFARVYVGDGNALELVSLQVTTTIEGPRARTVVDHIFRNPHDRQLEGTFEYPLPTGASPSYFAMFLTETRLAVPTRFRGGQQAPHLPGDALARLTPAELVKHVDRDDWGPLQEARVVGKQKALETYEEIVRGRIDPALLEYAGGNTFSGRVFPIRPKGYNRIIVAYEELLPATGERIFYRYPLPDCKLTELQFTLHANTTECPGATFEPKDAQREEGGGRLVLKKTWKEKGPGGDAMFSFTPPDPQVQAIAGRQGESGPILLYTRIRPTLSAEEDAAFAEHAVFLLDTSLSEHPDRFGISMRLLQRILESDPGIKHFNILAFNIGAAWVAPDGWLPNTPTGREKALNRLDGLVLEGATDLGAALDKLCQPGFDVPAGTPINVFLLSDGQITWGEPDAGTLVAAFESRYPFQARFHCYRLGLGAENTELFEALTRRGGGVFNVYGEADVAPAAKAHRHQCLIVEGISFQNGPAVSEVLVAGRKAAVYPGGELVIAARLAAPGKATLVLEGQFAGRKFVQKYPVEITPSGELAPRGWGEIAVASLLALNDPKLDSLIVAHCQQFGIASRLASLLVLENEADYKRLNLQEERGKTVPGGDLQTFLEEQWRQLGKKLSAKDAFRRQFANLSTTILANAGAEVEKLLGLLADAELELPAGSIAGALVKQSDVPPTYPSNREMNRRDVNVYLQEARRRSDANDADGAARVLSSVVEEYPTRADALRLVGYRLLDLKQAAQAAWLFQQVERSRPFEPHSYRDLARSLEESGRFGAAALRYEIILAGQWHNRFRDSLKTVAREEYVRMMQEAVRRKDVSPALKAHFGQRLEYMAHNLPASDLRVTISWNTDATDVDLWVIEPDGTKCFYQHQRTKNGGILSQDQTQGYGPERYHVVKAKPGTYTIVVHYFAANPNLLAGESHVNVLVTRFAGTPQETTERHSVILKKKDEHVEVARAKF